MGPSGTAGFVWDPQCPPTWRGSYTLVSLLCPTSLPLLIPPLSLPKEKNSLVFQKAPTCGAPKGGKDYGEQRGGRLLPHPRVDHPPVQNRRPLPIPHRKGPFFSPPSFYRFFFFFFFARSHFTSPMQWSVIPMFFFSNLVTLKSFYLQICDRLLLIICLIDKCLRLISFC